MKKFTIVKENGAVIPCLAELPKQADHVIIVVHGFASKKESVTNNLLLARLPQLGFGVVVYDQPGHGTEQARQEPLRIENCLSSLAAVERWVRRFRPGAEIGYFSSSFGAYITGIYISRCEHAGTHAFFRSAAVNMPKLMNSGQPVTPEQQRFIDENGYLPSDPAFGDVIDVPGGMLRDLAENDLFACFAPQHTAVCMIHGQDDPVVDVRQAQAFAEKFSVPITVVPGEGHSICNDPQSPELVLQTAAAFYKNT